MFHAAVESWLRARFGAPTPVQAAAWPAVATGADVLVAAPTGAGKTLAAFLFAIDELVRDAERGALSDETRVLYVSPLKALSADVENNLAAPLAGVAHEARALGTPLADIRSALRTGDTPASERRAQAARPPHVLVTTPESLYLLLTSESGRRGLSSVRTVIVDEVHAVLGDKRGAHLALSLERLESLVVAGGRRRPQRVGLSATVRPVDEAARFLVGNGRGAPAIVDVGLRREVDLAIEVPRDELGAVCTTEQWDEVYDRVAALANDRRTTLVFVGTRRLVERAAHALALRLGETHVAPHHGSMSRQRRLETERRLRAGELRLVVATASLELGIDIGDVDLVCLVGSPRSVAVALQRVGRSGHRLTSVPVGRLFPLTRDQLVESAAIVEAARRAEIEPTRMREAPLDVLAQQIVAEAACQDWPEDALFELVRRAAPYASLDRREFDAVVEMSASGVATRRGRSGALLHRDAVARRVRGRRGARLAALTSGGAIPDVAAYDVVLEPEGTKVGSLDEDYVTESMAGDVFLLGSSSWKIRRIAPGKVHVEAAPGAPPSVPFWLGEGPARSRELSRAVGELREAVVRRAPDASWLEPAAGLDRRGAELLRDYVVAGFGALGVVPSATTVVAERFFDETGGMQLVLHAPFGARINRAWGSALRKRFCRQFDFELQAAATDDGVLLSLGAQHSFPLESIFEMLSLSTLGEVLEQAALQSPLFRTRFRWNATRALVLPRFSGGKRVPPALLRMKADDLVAAVFPEQLGCQDNHGLMATIEPPDHPLVRETLRDCLVEPMDVEGLREVLAGLASGAIRAVARETPEPSVLSHEILNANPYAFLDDAPLEERRARAVTMRRGLPASVVERVGGLDRDAVEAVVAELAPAPRDADETHDLLLDVGALRDDEARALGLAPHLDRLGEARRAGRLALAHGPSFWVAAERAHLARAIWPARAIEPAVAELPAEPASRDEALAVVIGGRLALAGPSTATRIAGELDVDVLDVSTALARLELAGRVLRGRFLSTGPDAETEWCDRLVLARVHRRTVDRLRREVEPVTAAELMRFYASWQHVAPGVQLHGREGVRRVVAQLQGFEIAAGAWESHVLPARVARYEPSWLDMLCFSGEVAWGRLSPRESASSGPTRAAPIALYARQDAAWLRGEPLDELPEGLSHAARDVLELLASRGASFVDELVGGGRRLRCEVDDALGELVATGLVSCDGFEGLRALIGPGARRGAGPRMRPRRARTGSFGAVAAGRWSSFHGVGTGADVDDALERRARQYLRRWGVVLREVLAREPGAPAWRDLLRVYRTLEMRGEIRGGRLVSGLVGEQFALPEALDALRATRRAPPTGVTLVLSACDPLNLVGILVPGARVPAAPGHVVAFRDGVPVAPPTVGARSPRARASATE